MNEALGVSEEMRRALVRGFTRSDLLLLGELRDVSALARKLGFHAPVAVSREVQSACEALAAATGETTRRVLGRVLRAVVEVTVAGEGFDRNSKEPFAVPGLPFDLYVHADRGDDGRWVLTVYAMSESAALV